MKDYWPIGTLVKKDGLYRIDLLKKLLPPMAQDEAANYSLNNEFGVGSLPLYFNLFSLVRSNKKNPQQKNIRKFIQKSMTDNILITLTLLQYKSKGKDVIIHNFRQPDESQILEDIVGPDEYIKNSSTKQRYKALLGSDNLNEINSVFKWITGKDAYGLFINNKPEQSTERVVRFSAVSDRTNLYCYWVLQDSFVALGVRCKKILDSEEVLNFLKKYEILSIKELKQLWLDVR